MAKKVRGWFTGASGSRHVAIPLGQRKRLARCLSTCTTDEQADERAGLVREVARIILATGNAAELERWVGIACQADDAKALAVLAYARKLAAGKVATAVTVGPAGKTFAQVATMWTSGELARLYPDQVVVKRSVAGDVTRLDVLSKVVGAVPIATFTVADADRAMQSLPAGLRPATRRHYAQSLRRVLELAAYPLRLIPANPLPRLFLPRVRNDLALQVLFPDEEAALLACEAVPLAHRMFYGFLARVGFRKSEAIGDPDTGAEPLRWRDFDLARGVVRVARSKTEKPRPVPLDADVSAALAAWKEALAPSDDAPVFDGVAPAEAWLFREHLLAAGVDRHELHKPAKDSLAVRVHDLRATFVTVSMATGRPDTWIRDRTGHKTISMLDRYRRAARTFGELNAGPLAPMLDAVAGLRVNGASMGPPKPQETSGENTSDIKLVAPAGVEPARPSGPRILKRPGVPYIEPGREDSTGKTHADTARQAASSPPIDSPVDAERAEYTDPLERALGLAAAAGRWDVVAQLARELEARRLAAAGNVVVLPRASG